MLKAIKIRLYPNKTQTKHFNELLGCCRFVYNNCLNKKIESYINDNINESLTTLGKYFHNDLTKNIEYFWLNNQNTKVLKQAIIDMLDAYKRFFKQGNGFPKFKSKHNNKLSCRFPLEAISKLNDYSNYKISLANIKNIKFSCSQKYSNYLSKYKNGIRSATLSKTKSGKYFLSILVNSNSDESLILKYNSNVIGLDLGIKDFCITSNNDVFENHKFKKNKLNQIKRLQKQLSKKVKGSKNRNKIRIKIAKISEKISNQTNNYLHKISKKIINENQVIVIEDLYVKGMMKNHKLAEDIQSVSLSKFRQFLTYKSVFYGRNLITIDRFFPSSKLCSNCNHKKIDLKLSDRIYKCENCLNTLDRDINAAINIKNEGLRILNSNSV